jgi:tetratricopeptide (TPR) repeat protein
VTSAKSVFVCYAHADNAPRKRWLHRLLEHLAPVVRHDEITVWSDHNLQAGEQWDEEIAQQLAAARVAVLLVSPAFLASEYIANSELPVLLKRSHDDGLTILPVLLYPSLFDVARFKWPDPKNGPEEFTLSSLQAVGSPSETLSEMEGPKRDRAFVTLAKRIQSILVGVTQVRPSSPVTVRSEESSVVSISHLPSAGEFLIGREAELARLSAAWEAGREHIITVVGRGGEGKSNLVSHWLNEMAANDWRGAERVYGWSFYSQGTSDKAASADQFIDQALRFFGEKTPEDLKSPDARGERLAQLVGSKRNLLVLDGLEPLQYPPGAMHGRLKDPALQTLLFGLLAQNRGLCVITTREELPELASTKHLLSPEIQLPPLAPEAGARLLADLGTTGSNADRELVVRRLGGHAFSIQLLGTYLAEVFGGDITRAGEVTLLDEDSETGKHARHILGSYEKWLSGGTLAESDLPPDEVVEAKRTGAEMLAALRLLGLFDRPATMDAIEVLRAEPAIAGLTEPIVSLSDAEWKRTLARLRNLQLIDHDLGEVETLDAHPLLREYFAEQLEKVPDSAKEAHRRLYKHFKNCAPDRPETLSEMMPLFQAVIHGCKAGEWREALDEVYYRRVDRGIDFAAKRLGAIGACLASLMAFYSDSWRRFGASFSPNDTLYVFGMIGYYLRAVGRLDESVDPMSRGFEIALHEQDWINASQQAENLSEVHLTIGDVAASLRFAEQAVELSARSGNVGRIANSETDVADTLNAAAATQEALAAFDAAEGRFRQVSSFPILIGLAGFEYTDVLMEGVKTTAQDASKLYRDIRTRSEEQLKIVSTMPSALLDLALPRLLIGRTLTLDASDRQRARMLFDDAVSLLRQATQDYLLPFGLLWRAEFARSIGDREAADKDLTESEQLAERHGMLRWQIESAVERAQFHHAFGEPDKAREKLAEAKRLIAKTDKPYVPHVWTYEEMAPPPYIAVFKEGQIVGYHRCDHAIAELERLL